MGKYWDWYQVEFERVARRRLSPERTAAIIESLREHVLDSKGEFQNEFRSPDEAEKIAVKNLGAPSLILRAELGNPARNWLPVWVAAVGLVLLTFFVCLSTEPWSFNIILPLSVVTPCLVLLASLGNQRPKFWALGGVTAICGVVMALVMCFGWIDMNQAGGLGFMPKWHISSVTENNQRLVEQYQRQRTEIADTWTRIQGADTASAKQLIEDGGSYRVPVAAVFKGHNGSWVLIRDFDEAKRKWSQNLNVLTGPADQAIQRISANLAAMKDPLSFDPHSIWVKNGFLMVGVIVMSYLVLAFSHGVGLFVSAIPLWMLRRKWKVAI